MSLHELDRQLLVVPWTIYAGDLPNIDITPGSDAAAVRVARNMLLRELHASAAALTAASQFIVDIVASDRSGTPVIATVSSAVPYVAPVVAVSTGLEVRLNAGETLKMLVRGTDADTDDATGFVCVLWCQIVPNLV